MEPLSMIVGALTAGATAAGKEVATQAIKDGYAAVKHWVVSRFGTSSEVATALQRVEQKPDSEGRQAVLKEELQSVQAEKQPELLQLAQSLLDLLKKEGLAGGVTYQAHQTGSGAIAQGAGAVAVGQGGVAIGGSVQGNVGLPGQEKPPKV